MALRRSVFRLSSGDASRLGSSSGPSASGLRVGAALGAGGVLLGSWAWRWYSDALRSRDLQATVHPDGSLAAIRGARRQVGPESVRVSYRNAEGQLVHAAVDKGKLEQSLRSGRRAEALLASQISIKEEATKQLHAELEQCFDVVRRRAARFADWYFAYPTTFRLMREAVTSAVRHSADISRSGSLRDAIVADMDALLMQKYERIVLQPELNDAPLREAFVRTAQRAHQQFCEAARDSDARLLSELAAETSHMEPPNSDSVQISLDWVSQLHKIKVVPASFEKAPELTLALSAGGALVGKAACTAAGAKVLGATGAKAAAGMAGKFGSPFVAKALAAGSGALACGSLTGPLGAVLGGTLGLGADFVVNLGLELLQRNDFVKEVEMVVRATQQDYFRSLEGELHRAIEVWVEDALHLLPHTVPAPTESSGE